MSTEGFREALRIFLGGRGGSLSENRYICNLNKMMGEYGR